MTKARRTLAACALLALGAAPASAQNVVVKMATIVPDGSAWHQILKEMGAKWAADSGGRVTLRLYPGSVAGDDPDVVRKMRLKTLNAALLTSAGLGEIDKTLFALQVPMMYSSTDEIDYVLDKMSPRLEQAMLAKGFVVLNWADGGWVHFFTAKLVTTPDDLKSLKLFSWAGDNDSAEVWKSAGFNPLPLPATEIATALHTGLVNAVPAPPQAAVLLRWYENAKNMTNLKWFFLLGGTVMTKDTLDRIPADVQPKIREAAQEAGRRLRDEIRKAADRDIQAMQKRGLNVVPVDAKTEALWRASAEGAYQRIRGPI